MLCFTVLFSFPIHFNVYFSIEEICFFLFVERDIFKKLQILSLSSFFFKRGKEENEF